MTSRISIVAVVAATVLAGSALPAAAQVADFFCSTFSIGCEPPPPPPPPAPAPIVEQPAPKKHVHHAKAAKKTVAAKDAAAAPQ